MIWNAYLILWNRKRKLHKNVINSKVSKCANCDIYVYVCDSVLCSWVSYTYYNEWYAVDIKNTHSFYLIKAYILK